MESFHGITTAALITADGASLCQTSNSDQNCLSIQGKHAVRMKNTQQKHTQTPCERGIAPQGCTAEPHLALWWSCDFSLQCNMQNTRNAVAELIIS